MESWNFLPTSLRGGLPLAPDSGFFGVVRRFLANGQSDTTFAGDGIWVGPGTSAFAANAQILDGALSVSGGQRLSRFNVEPAVIDFDFLFETAPQRLHVGFNDDIGVSLSDADLVIRNITTNTVIPTSAYDLQPFSAAENSDIVNFAGVLADGNYTVTFSSAGIENKQSMNLAGGLVQEFFFLAGDANRDRAVNIADFAIVAGRFNLPGTFSQGDFNYDSKTDISDFAILASKFNTSLPDTRLIVAASGTSTSSMATHGAPRGAHSTFNLVRVALLEEESSYPH